METLFDSNSTHWIVWVIMLPLISAMLCFLWPRRAAALGMATVIGNLFTVWALCLQVLEQGVLRYTLGGWDAPLGIGLYADGLSILMLLMTAVVSIGVSLYAIGYFGQGQNNPAGFWPLWLFLLTALNALFLSADIFNLYVTLELLGLAAVAMVALAGGKNALAGAMRYLLVGLLASLAYLLGVALLYHTYGAVDIATLGQVVTGNPATWAALGLMVTAMLIKTALFPLHFWLPPAHSSAPAPVSALLSALVVKGSFYLLLRLLFDVFPDVGPLLSQALGVLGAAAILWGSFQALRQTRLKLLVAYSTVAQLGYLFLPFPMAAAGATIMAWNGGIYFILSHALAKAAMFLAAGNILKFGGHDRITGLDRVAQRLPLTLAAFGLAGVSIMGLPPSGGFIAKWLLLEAALTNGQWWWAAVMVAGGILAAAYVFKVVGYAFTQAEVTHDAGSVPSSMEWAALGLAVGALALGLLAPQSLSILEIANPWTPAAEGGVL